MSVTVELSEELLVALRSEADRRGITLEAVITESLSEHVFFWLF